jgi:hypothetical protein
VALCTCTPSRFIREIPGQAVTTLDLLSIVAGGYGTTQHRERGIDLKTGVDTSVGDNTPRVGDGCYHPITWHKLIDGVFIPDGRNSPVVIDSAGHAFRGFPATLGLYGGPIWARAVEFDPSQVHLNWIHGLANDGDRYMPKKRGLLSMHANAGITFNLKAMRDLFPGQSPARLRATGGVARVTGLADLWFFVDGRLVWKRMHLTVADPPSDIAIDLPADAFFLTIAATDGGDGVGAEMGADWVVVGDPIIELSPIGLGHENNAHQGGGGIP